MYGKKDIMISAKTGAGKSLIYQAVLLMNSGAIILTIIPIIALMEDQERELKQRDVITLALTATIVKVNPNIWKWLEQGKYSVIFASPKIVLAPQSHFWKYTISRKGNEFCRRLTCITIDKAHLIWGWREFRRDYRHIDLLRSYFPNVLIVSFSATMTNNVLDYIRAFLNLCLPVRLYKRSLDRPNIIYGIAEIKKPGYKELDVFVLSISSLSAIPKTIIFVESINEGMALIEYLRTKLLDDLKDKAEQVIQCFHSNLLDKSRKLFTEDFL